MKASARSRYGVQVDSRRDDWLSAYARNVSSQFGEDGILEKVLEIIGETSDWCVEFGAWDGVVYSNTHHLVLGKGYSAVLIEADPVRFEELCATYRDRPSVVPFNRFVGFGEHDSLDAILSTTDVPLDFDVLSIDIDGNDYHVWEATKRYRPKVVVIEFNPTVPSGVEFVQPRDMSVAQGSGIASITGLGRRKGYELVALTTANAILVDSRYFDLFGIEDNSPAALRHDESGITHLFHGYDGTIFIRGNRRLVWHDLPLDETRFQQLPRRLRRYPDAYGRLARLLLRVYRRFYSIRMQRSD